MQGGPSYIFENQFLKRGMYKFWKFFHDTILQRLDNKFIEKNNLHYYSYYNIKFKKLKFSKTDLDYSVSKDQSLEISFI